MTISTRSPDKSTGWLPRAMGQGYGLVYGLFFGLAAWGYDGLALAHKDAELAGGKLALGLPLLLLIGALTSALTRKSARAGVWVGTWMVSGALFGVVAGLVPFAGYTVATWIVEPLLWGRNLYPMGPEETARTAFVAAVTACIGSAVGLAGNRLHRAIAARDQALSSPTNQGREHLPGALILCLFLAVSPGILADDTINRRLRVSQQTVYDYSWSGFESLTNSLIQAALESSSLEFQPEGVSVSERMLGWLASQRPEMSEDYKILRAGQRGGWVITSASFDTGYVLVCYFDLREAPPVVLDHCRGKNKSEAK
jgi:hypothetical protein